MPMNLGMLLVIMTIPYGIWDSDSAQVEPGQANPDRNQPTGQSPRAEGKPGVHSKGPHADDWLDVRNGQSAAADCARCHVNCSERADGAELLASVPRLCSTCHREFASLDGWIHGPVVTGDCLFCHDPHWSDNGALLKKPVPGLCYECHATEMLGLVTNHSDESYRRCGDCHESHAGSDRRLLTQRFLRTNAGVPYVDQGVFRRPRYAFLDRRQSLAGLRGVRIVPNIERPDLLRRYGLTPDLLKTEVERCLRDRDIRILSDDPQASEQAGLHVVLRLVELRLPGYTNEILALSGSLSMFLRQTVELLSQSSDAQRSLCLATTWDTSAVVVWGIPQIQAGLGDAIRVLVGQFCSDYLVANPSDKQPMSPRGTSGNSDSYIER